MTRYIAIMCVTLGMLIFTGCSGLSGSNEVTESYVESSTVQEENEAQQIGLIEENFVEDPDWRLILTAEDITISSMTLVFVQNGGTVKGKLSTGEWYYLQRLTEEGWSNLERIPEAEKLYWALSAIPLPLGESTEVLVDWESLYGQLTPGQYRIGKDVQDRVEMVSCDETVMWFEFEIKAE